MERCLERVSFSWKGTRTRLSRFYHQVHGSKIFSFKQPPINVLKAPASKPPSSTLKKMWWKTKSVRAQAVGLKIYKNGPSPETLLLENPESFRTTPLDL